MATLRPWPRLSDSPSGDELSLSTSVQPYRLRVTPGPEAQWPRAAPRSRTHRRRHRCASRRRGALRVGRTPTSTRSNSMAGYFSIPVIADPSGAASVGRRGLSDLGADHCPASRLSGVERGRSCRLNEHPLALFILMVSAHGAVGVPSCMAEHGEHKDEPDESGRDRHEKQGQHDGAHASMMARLFHTVAMRPTRRPSFLRGA